MWRQPYAALLETESRTGRNKHRVSQSHSTCKVKLPLVSRDNSSETKRTEVCLTSNGHSISPAGTSEAIQQVSFLGHTPSQWSQGETKDIFVVFGSPEFLNHVPGIFDHVPYRLC